MRTFVGIPLPPTYKEIMRKTISKITSLNPPTIRWVRPENFHLTLHFIGEIPDTQVKDIEKVLGEVHCNSFTFCAGGGGVFPSLRRPRVLWVGCREGATSLQQLFKMVGNVLVSSGALENVPLKFSPHLTLGRIKASAPAQKWKDILGVINDFSWPQISIGSFVLWKSTLTPRGPIYTPIKEFSF